MRKSFHPRTEKGHNNLEQANLCFFAFIQAVFFLLVLVFVFKTPEADQLSFMETSDVRVIPATYVNPYANGKDFGCGAATLCVMGWRVL